MQSTSYQYLSHGANGRQMMSNTCPDQLVHINLSVMEQTWRQRTYDFCRDNFLPGYLIFCLCQRINYLQFQNAWCGWRRVHPHSNRLYACTTRESHSLTRHEGLEHCAQKSTLVISSWTLCAEVDFLKAVHYHFLTSCPPHYDISDVLP